MLLYSPKVTHIKKTSALIMILAMMLAAAACVSRNDALDDELLSAAMTGDSALVENLLDRGADINARSEAGNTALDIAYEEGHQQLISALRTAGAAS